MKKRRFGNTGSLVSEIGFGCWQLGETDAWSGPTGREAVSLIHEAIDLGCDCFDTSPNYGSGNSERILGEALKAGRREKVVLNTKFGHSGESGSDFSPKALISSVEESLRRLQTDYIDSVIIHNPPFELLHGDAAHWEVFSRLQEAGKIRAYGASVDSPEEVKAVLQSTDSAVLEIFFNMVHQGMRDVFELIDKKEVTAVVKVPLDSGWLTGKYDESSRFTGVRSRWSKEQIQQRAKIVKDYHEMLTENRSLREEAIAFILSYPEIATIIPGIRNSEQLRSNLAAVGTTLSREQRLRYEAYYDENLRGIGVPW